MGARSERERHKDEAQHSSKGDGAEMRAERLGGHDNATALIAQISSPADAPTMADPI